MDRPVSLDQHAAEYEALALYVASEIESGQIVNFDDAQWKLRQLMAGLGVRRVRHGRDGAFVFLSGDASVVTGQFSYVYKLGDEQNKGASFPNDSIEHEYLHGRWYAGKRYFH